MQSSRDNFENYTITTLLQNQANGTLFTWKQKQQVLSNKVKSTNVISSFCHFFYPVRFISIVIFWDLIPCKFKVNQSTASTTKHEMYDVKYKDVYFAIFVMRSS